MNAIEKYHSPTEVISREFLERLSLFALAYRWHGARGCDRKGDLTELEKAWEREFGYKLIGIEPALELCRVLSGDGKRAFDV